MRFELTSYFKKIRITYANLPQPVALPTELSGHMATWSPIPFTSLFIYLLLYQPLSSISNLTSRHKNLCVSLVFLWSGVV